MGSSGATNKHFQQHDSCSIPSVSFFWDGTSHLQMVVVYGIQLTGWWFGTFFHILGIIIPNDSYFSEGWLNHQPAYDINIIKIHPTSSHCFHPCPGRTPHVLRKKNPWSPVTSAAVPRHQRHLCPQLQVDRTGNGSWWELGFTWLLWLSIQLGISSSQLTFTPSFFRGVGIPPTR